MNRKIILASLAFAAMPAPAVAAGDYYVRNDTPWTQFCGLRPPHRDTGLYYNIRPGTDRTWQSGNEDHRTLLCYVGAGLTRMALEPGVRYAMVRLNRRSGRWRLRVIGP